jgi:hypothetical protein
VRRQISLLRLCDGMCPIPVRLPRRRHRARAVRYRHRHRRPERRPARSAVAHSGRARGSADALYDRRRRFHARAGEVPPGRPSAASVVKTVSLPKSVALLSFGIASAAFTAYGEAFCINYGGRIHVHGTLARQVFPGPPGYESIARGDTAEIYYVLKIFPPTCIGGNPSDPDEPAITNIADIQLMLTGRDQYVFLEHMIGKEIKLSGGLMAARTGHHHTPVLLSEVQLEAN